MLLQPQSIMDLLNTLKVLHVAHWPHSNPYPNQRCYNYLLHVTGMHVCIHTKDISMWFKLWTQLNVQINRGYIH